MVNIIYKTSFDDGTVTPIVRFKGTEQEAIKWFTRSYPGIEIVRVF